VLIVETPGGGGYGAPPTAPGGAEPPAAP